MRYLNKSPQASVVVVLAMVAAVALGAACGGGSGGGTTSDAGPDAPADTGLDASPEARPTACDPAAQDCASDQKCDFHCAGASAAVECQANGSVALGGACSTTNMSCARGGGCISLPSGGGPTCRKYCTGDGDCATGERCHNVMVGVACSGGTTQFLLHLCY